MIVASKPLPNLPTLPPALSLTNSPPLATTTKTSILYTATSCHVPDYINLFHCSSFLLGRHAGRPDIRLSPFHHSLCAWLAHRYLRPCIPQSSLPPPCAPQSSLPPQLCPAQASRSPSHTAQDDYININQPWPRNQHPTCTLRRRSPCSPAIASKMIPLPPTPIRRKVLATFHSATKMAFHNGGRALHPPLPSTKCFPSCPTSKDRPRTPRREARHQA